MIEFRVGDVRKLLAELPDGSVDLIATSWPYLAQRSYLPADHPMKRYEIGQESMPAEFIATLLEVTAEFRRVLAPHGSIATELGDGFSDSGGAGGDYNRNGLREGQPRFGKKGGEGWPLARCLEMAPELYRVALAYGIHPLTGEPSPAGRWRVRNVIVHGRPNPPVGALGDKFRPACSYWAVACTGRRWFDLDAVRHKETEPGAVKRKSKNHSGANPSTGWGSDSTEIHQNPAGAPPLDWFEDEGDQFERDLWTLPTSPYPGQHFATFSPELIQRFIVSMCPLRVCLECGKPSVRLTKVTQQVNRMTNGPQSIARRHIEGGSAGFPVRTDRLTETLGWSDCGHNNWRPGLVLDPFGGSGTTGMVAAGNGRDCLMFDLDERCVDLARDRIGLYLNELAHPPEAEALVPSDEQEAMF